MTIRATSNRVSQRGFTMIEILVVVAIIAISASLVSLSMRDGAQNRLDQEAARLAALLEGARAEARVAGLPVRWQPATLADAATGAPQFQFVGLPASTDTPSRWLNEGVSAEVVGARALILGPEPLIGAQRVVLQLDERRAVVATDGLGPFVLVEDTAP
jgi:general secretion pathway protein H